MVHILGNRSATTISSAHQLGQRAGAGKDIRRVGTGVLKGVGSRCPARLIDIRYNMGIRTISIPTRTLPEVDVPHSNYTKQTLSSPDASVPVCEINENGYQTPIAQ